MSQNPNHLPLILSLSLGIPLALVLFCTSTIFCARQRRKKKQHRRHLSKVPEPKPLVDMYAHLHNDDDQHHDNDEVSYRGPGEERNLHELEACSPPLTWNSGSNRRSHTLKSSSVRWSELEGSLPRDLLPASLQSPAMSTTTTTGTPGTIGESMMMTPNLGGAATPPGSLDGRVMRRESSLRLSSSTTMTELWGRDRSGFQGGGGGGGQSGAGGYTAYRPPLEPRAELEGEERGGE